MFSVQIIVCCLCLFSKVKGLEMSLDLNLQASPFSRQPCGVLTCKESNASGDSSGAISSMSIFKTGKSSRGEGDSPGRGYLVATLTSETPSVTRVSDAMKVAGILEAGGVASLRVEMLKTDDCLAQFTCEVRTVDTQGRQLVHTNRLQPQGLEKCSSSPTGTSGLGRPGVSLQTLLLLQQLDTKLATLGTSLDGKFAALENRFEDKILSVHDDIKSLKSDLENKIETRVMDKLCQLDTKISSKGDEQEEEMGVREQVKAGVDASLVPLRTELEHGDNVTLTGLLTLSKSLERQLNSSFMVSSSVQTHLTELLSLEQKNQERVENLTRAVANVLTSSEGLYQHIGDGLDRLESNANNKSAETLSSVRQMCFRFNATIESALQSHTEETSPLQGCSKGMASLATPNSFPYPVVRPSRTIGLTTPYLCDTVTDGGGWIIIQRRTSGDVNFYRGWDEYRKGFGSLDGNFWLGNENIHRISSSGTFELRIDLRYQGKSTFAHYSSFSLDSERNSYTIRLGKFDGTAGDSLGGHNGHKFSTFDRDNDAYRGNCAASYTGAWWYEHCHASNLNGRWGEGANKGPRWSAFSGDQPVAFSEMKIRRV